MAERKIVFQDKTLNFQGLFDLKGLFRTINTFFADHSYDPFENKNFQEVYEDEKKVIFELLPYKKITDYYRLEIRVWAVFEHLKDVEVEIKGVKQKLLKGDANFTFDATLITDYENRWEGKGVYFFFRSLVDKFIYKGYTDRYEDAVTKDVRDLMEEIRAYLNMFRYTV
ncbi:MAG: hypothetical protein V1866_01815 [archaeon]